MNHSTLTFIIADKASDARRGPTWTTGRRGQKLERAALTAHAGANNGESHSSARGAHDLSASHSGPCTVSGLADVGNGRGRRSPSLHRPIDEGNQPCNCAVLVGGDLSGNALPDDYDMAASIPLVCMTMTTHSSWEERLWLIFKEQ